MRVGAAGENFLEITGRGLDDLVLCVREELLYLLFLGRAEGGGNSHVALVEIGPVVELALVGLQRQRHGGKREVAVRIAGCLGTGRRDRGRACHVVFAGDNAADQGLPVGGDEFKLDIEVLGKLGHDVDVIAGIAVGCRVLHGHRVPVAGGADLENAVGEDVLKSILRLGRNGSASERDRGDRNLDKFHGKAPCL